MNESFENAHTGARLVLEEPSADDVLAYVRFMPAGTGRAVAHVHLNFDQHFTVLSGHAHYRVDGREGELAPGDELVVPRSSAHIDPYPDGSEPLTLRNSGSPEVPGARDYARALGQGIRDGKTNGQDEFHLLHLMVVVRAGGSESFVAGVPIALQRYVIIPLLGAVGRALGYRPPGEPDLK